MSEGPSGSEPPRCDFCRHEIVLEAVTVEDDGATYRCCSQACARKLEEGDFVFAEYHGAHLFDPGVAGLDVALPQGMRRNSFVLFTGLVGTRQQAILAELAWRALRRGEPVVAVTFTEPPGSFVQHFLSLEWNVLPYLEAGQFQLIDAFTYRMDDPDRMYDRMNRWNHHLYGVVEDVTETVRDAGDLSEIQNKLDNCLEHENGTDEGIVVIDSLTELGSLVQPIQAYDFVKDLRADVCKGRFVPVFAGASLTGEDSGFPHDLGYMMDGVVQLHQSGDIVEDTLIKRLRIRKMTGVLSLAEWTAYEYTSNLGMVTFDPREQLEAAAKADADEADGGNSSGSSEAVDPETSQAADSADNTDSGSE